MSFCVGNSAWELFDGTNYNGKSVIAQPGRYDVDWVNSHIENNKVSSVRSEFFLFSHSANVHKDPSSFLTSKHCDIYNKGPQPLVCLLNIYINQYLLTLHLPEVDNLKPSIV